ncbi:MAG: hypothetical protein JJT77_02870 [Crocinitomicaceae bacterium]|nr:hypothetical protein [Crocinitomicaceae bacterium]
MKHLSKYRNIFLILPWLLMSLFGCSSDQEEINNNEFILPIQALRNLENDQVVFYNTTLFFDSILHGRTVMESDFHPDGKFSWTPERYLLKAQKMAEAVLYRNAQNPPAFMGLADVENQFVVLDILKNATLASEQYGVLMGDAVSKNGLRLAFVYANDVFFPQFSAKNDAAPVELGTDGKPVANAEFQILHVPGHLKDSVPLHFIINRWDHDLDVAKKASSALTNLVQDIIEESSNLPNIIIMGDFGVQPNHPLLKNILPKGYINWALQTEKKWPLGSYCKHANYTVDCFLSDQILTFFPQNESDALYAKDFLVHDAVQFVFDRDGILFPDRTFNPYSGEWYGGYSDHFAVSLKLWYKL